MELKRGFVESCRAGLSEGMQIIQPLSLSPEQYISQEYHRRIPPPENCPYCRHAHCLKALGYYDRFITALLAQVLNIWVRRFLCHHCRHTVSCLPEFAQPYRLVNTPTVQAAFQREDHRPEVQRWKSLTDSYWRRFQKHLPEILPRIGYTFGPYPQAPSATSIWNLLLKACGSLATATRQLVDQFRTCLFGTYRCHQPQAYHAR
jgi:Domain of unknown function (DUF6431)